MTTTWLRLSLVVSLLGAVSAACSSNADEPKYPTTDAFCAGKAAAECTNVATTCGVDQGTCVTARKKTCLEFAAASVSGSRAYKPENAEACITAVNTAYKDQRLSVKEEDTTVSGSLGNRCARVFEGRAAKGEACTSSFDCAGAFTCSKARTATATLVCAVKAPKPQGEGCANAGDTCAAGTFCDAAGTVTCVPAKKKDEPCSTADPNALTFAPCGETLRCDSVSSTCTDRVPSGGACLSHADCATTAPYCYESSTGKKCAPELIFSPEATACKAYGAL